MDLYDASRCPVAERCESCGAGAGLTVATAHTPIGVLCVTLCGDCEDANKLPPIRAWSVAAERIGDHCVHLGIDLDQAAALLEAEEKP